MIEKKRAPRASLDHPDSNEDKGSSRRPRGLQAKIHQRNRRLLLLLLPLLLLLLPRSAIALPSLITFGSEGVTEDVSGRDGRVPSPTSATITVAARKIGDSAPVFETLSTQKDAALLSEPRSTLSPLPLSLVVEREGALEMRGERACKNVVAETESDYSEPEPEPEPSDVGLEKRPKGCFHQHEYDDFCFGEGTPETTPRQFPRNNTLAITPKQHPENYPETTPRKLPRNNKPVITPAVTPYIVRWVDYHPIQDHEQLLSQASGGLSCATSDGPFPGNPFDGDDPGSSPENAGERFREASVDVLEGAAGWCLQLVERRNAATTGEFPSDFAVVRLVQQHQQRQWHPLSAANFNVTVGSSRRGSKASCIGEWDPTGPNAVAEGESVLEALRGSDLVKGVYEDVVSGERKRKFLERKSEFSLIPKPEYLEGRLGYWER